MKSKIMLFKMINCIDNVTFTYCEKYPIDKNETAEDAIKFFYWRDKCCDYYIKYGVKNVKLLMLKETSEQYIKQFLNSEKI